jgi:hypothetical protein
MRLREGGDKHCTDATSRAKSEVVKRDEDVKTVLRVRIMQEKLCVVHREVSVYFVKIFAKKKCDRHFANHFSPSPFPKCYGTVWCSALAHPARLDFLPSAGTSLLD